MLYIATNLEMFGARKEVYIKYAIVSKCFGMILCIVLLQEHEFITSNFAAWELKVHVLKIVEQVVKMFFPFTVCFNM